MKVEDFPPDKLKLGSGMSNTSTGVERFGLSVPVKNAVIVDTSVDTSVDTKEDEKEDEADDSDLESDLSDAINLLEDAYNTMDLILDGRSYAEVGEVLQSYPHLREEFQRISNEILTFTCQYTDLTNF